MPNPFQKSSKTRRFFEVMKVVFLTRIPMNVLLLLVIIGTTIIGFNYLQPGGTPTGKVILEQECPECICEESEETECESDCSLCPIKTKVETIELVKYQCPSGDIVEDLEECEESFPEVPEESSATVEGITFFIDDVEFEKDDEDSGFVTAVKYTIINKGGLPIVPKIEVKVYEDWTLNVKKSVANKVVNPEIVVNHNEYVTRKDRVRIYFNGEEQTVRLLLVNSLPTIEQDIVAVTEEISLDDI